MNPLKAYIRTFGRQSALCGTVSLRSQLMRHPMSHSLRAASPTSPTFIHNHSTVSPKSQKYPKISCQCGTISFPASRAEPLSKFVCHCTECQKQSASAFGTAAIFPSEGIFPFPKELQPHIGMWARLVDSGNTVECYFCKVCGVRILHRVIFKDGTPRPSLSVRGGCVEGFNLIGAKHIYTRSALVPVPEGSELGAPRVKP